MTRRDGQNHMITEAIVAAARRFGDGRELSDEQIEFIVLEAMQEKSLPAQRRRALKVARRLLERIS